MQFNRIRLSGFKSFVEPTELVFEPGLTGVVGPNGCGKSNLLEAIRWVMGESSPKSLRGAGMDDVIFSGTSSRPPRNLAEVTITLDNTDRSAPAAYNDSEVIDVSRRIERERGSAYRINGREVRAKDVQLLFADAATGAHSPALVSQGSIGSIISAKPTNRRAILEEAAGIVGLHSRRKEAESRLKAAENNLLRLDDVVVQMEAQVASLKRQARQATRYRNISGDLRRAEASLLFVRWRAAADAVQELESGLQKAQTEVGELTRVATQFTTEQTNLSAKLPELRQKEAEVAAATHRLTVARENLDAEAERLKQHKAELEDRAKQVAIDLEREAEFRDDAADTARRLGEEHAKLEKEKSAEARGEQDASSALEGAHAEASDAESGLDELSATAARERARHESLTADIDMLEQRILRLEDERQKISEDIGKLREKDGYGQQLDAARKDLTKARNRFDELEEELTVAEALRLEAQETRDVARSDLSTKEAALAGIEAEIRGIRGILDAGKSGDHVPVAEELKVEAGYEVALGAALGDDLNAPAGADTPVGWRELPPLDDAPVLPSGAKPLSNFVSGPAALARRLAQVGVITGREGDALAKSLLPGQRLVSKEGALWRWDGFHARADAVTPTAARLAQRNRLEALAGEQTTAEADLASAKDALDKTEASVDSAHDGEQSARAKRAEADRAVAEARNALTAIDDEGSERTSRMAALSEGEERVTVDLEESHERLANAETEIEALPDSAALDSDLADARESVEALRTRLAEARATYDGLHRISQERERRLADIAGEEAAWKERMERADRQIEELNSRSEQTGTQLKEIAEGPQDIEARRKALLDQISKAEAARSEAADALAKIENAVREKDHDLRKAQTALAEARETRIRQETAQEAAQERKREIAGSILEKFGCTPSDVLEKVEVNTNKELPDLEALEKRLTRLRAERERLGAVNLRADQELQEIAEQIAHLASEKQDLESAIGRLRQGIRSLNREGRERMLAAFEQVNAHFSDLFMSLFGGGHAHLELIESDDPLDAGLEIMASPPGKKLQTLSLLSGGEQALTAISLIFAVFITNPAPICVLDEVDAPLDDANVERFCGLLDEIEAKTGTRFLIVTHNAVTMARMDRLFGVTMSERGVSQLVPVDLQRAEELRAVG